MKITLFLLLGVLLFASCTTEPIAINEQMEDSCILTETRSQLCFEEQKDYSFYERYEPKAEPITIDLPDGNRVYLDPVDSVYFSGDMIFSQEFIDAIYANATRARSAVTANTNLYWSGKVIKYMIPGATLSPQEKQTIVAALNDISNATHLTFEYDPSAPHVNKLVYVSSVDAQVSYSPIGRQSGTYNNIQLAYDGFSKGTVIHETLHSLGFFHEHSRTDRDNYVTIIEGNINPEYLYAFDTFTGDYGAGYNLGPFDFSSIMLYSSKNGFAIDSSLPTITKKDGSTFIGQRNGLSDGDIAGLNYVYGPKPILTTTEISYEDNGDSLSRDELTTYSNVISFVDKNNNPITLTYPRLLWVECIEEITPTNGETTIMTTTTQLTIPAGTTLYNLGNTQKIWQADMGIDRYRYYSTYSLTYY